jgi:hypothetical protein
MAPTATAKRKAAATARTEPKAALRQPDLSVDFQRPSLYPKQEAAIYSPARYACIEASTKSGKTWGCIVWLAEQAIIHGRPGRQFWWVAPFAGQARIAYRRMKLAITGGVAKPNDTELTLTLFNGAVIWFKTGEKPDALYGEDVFAAVIDESTRCREEAWHAVRSVITHTKGLVRIIGNVKGKKNWAFKMCKRAEAGEPDMSYAKLTWRDAVAAGIMDQPEVEDARRQLPEAVFKELYEAEPSDDEGNPFGLAAIAACKMDRFSVDPVACWGWDLGKHLDWTAGVALDRKGRMVNLVRFQAPWGETKRRIIQETKGKAALVDATGIGDAIVEDLSTASGNFEGFVFTTRSKQDLMELLQSEIQQTRLGLTGPVLLTELEMFEYEFRGRDGRFTGVFYSAPPGMHDDCVCALALATKHLGIRGQPFQFSTTRDKRRDDLDPGADNTPGYDEPQAGQGWENRSGLI